MVSASPDATWLAASPSVTAANTPDSAAPARMPHSAPTAIEPVTYAPAKPQAAPTIIMPSTPRFSTPARSTTSSPEAASSSGVDAVITVRRTASMNSMDDLRREQQAEAVEDERVAGEHVEQQDALEHLGEIERHFQRNLRALAADEGEREEQRGDQYSDGMQPAKERHDNRGEAIARRDVGLEVVDGRRDLDDAGEPGERTGDREGHHGEPFVTEARKACGARRGADQLDLESAQRAAEHDRRPGDHQQRNDRAEMQPAALNQHRHRRDGIEFGRGREVEAFRIAPWPAGEIVEQQFGDIDQHQRSENLTGAKAHLE